MDCVIRVINGPDQGSEHRLQPGPNLIGRGKQAALKLSPEDISWEHAVITRQGDEYYVENLSAVGTWVGESKIDGRVRLRPRDKVRLSKETVLRLDAADGGGGLLANRAFLVTALVAMLGLLVGVVFYQGRSGPARGKGPDDWQAAYNALAPWLRQHAARKRVAPEAVDLFQKAWRLEQAEDYKNAQPAWARLQVLLAAAEGNLHCLAMADKYQATKDAALQGLLTPPPGYTPSEEELAGAMAQFVRRRLEWDKDRLEKSILKPK